MSSEFFCSTVFADSNLLSTKCRIHLCSFGSGQSWGGSHQAVLALGGAGIQVFHFYFYGFLFRAYHDSLFF